MEAAKCRQCGANILWTRHDVTKNLMALDALPVPVGNVVIIDGLGHVMNESLFEPMIDKPKYQSHFVTCPHRKPKDGKKCEPKKK